MGIKSGATELAFLTFPAIHCYYKSLPTSISSLVLANGDILIQYLYELNLNIVSGFESIAIFLY